MKRIIKKLATLILAAALTLPILAACSQQEKPELLDFLNYTPHFNEEYAVLEKSPDKDFIVLNLSDTQLNDSEAVEGTVQREVLDYTIDELIKKTNPDLITISGDVAWAHEFISYKNLFDILDSYGIPWAPVWGNHDNENLLYYWEPDEPDYESIEKRKHTIDDDPPTALDDLEELVMQYEYSLFQKGPDELGSGNYVISIEENGTPITALFMMDTHNKDTYIDENGEEFIGDGKLSPEQLKWYQYRIESMKLLGYKDSAMVVHIPINAYMLAFEEAFNKEYNPNSITLQDSFDDKYWNEGYEDSFGVNYEGIWGARQDEGAIGLFEELDHTKYVIAGHQHTNNFVIKYRGVNLIYSMHTGMGCYWDSRNNGGTVLRISSNGIEEVYHEFINVDHIVAAHAE